MDDLEKLLAEETVEEKETPVAASEEAEKPTQPEETKDPEVLKKEEIKANLDRAILEAQTELKRIRKERQKAKVEPEEEETPKINFEDPSAKAWDKHIRENVNPLQQEMEKEKSEIRNFALQRFLSEKPALARNAEKVKELIATYERIRTASERTQEGVLLDLDRAYAATFHKELIEAARAQRVEQAQQDIVFSDIGVSRGATTYSQPQTKPKERLSPDEQEIVARWDKQLAGMGIGEKK